MRKSSNQILDGGRVVINIKLSEVSQTEQFSEEMARRTIESAILAPSGHNLQPWKFRIGDGYVDLIVDKSRTQSVIDPDGREAVMSCGAALFHLRLAVRCEGCQDVVTLYPDKDTPDWIARVQFGMRLCASADEIRLLHAIPRRFTNRQPFDRQPLPRSLMPELIHAAQQEGADLDLIESPAQRSTLLDLSAEAARLLVENPVIRDEMRQWFPERQVYSPTNDSCSQAALADSSSRFRAGPAPVVHDLDFDRERKIVEQAAVLAVLTTQTNSPYGWVAAGEALAHVLLRAEVDGVSATFMNQTMYVEHLRPALTALLNKSMYPQLVFAMGYAPRVLPAPRRSVLEVLIANEPE